MPIRRFAKEITPDMINVGRGVPLSQGVNFGPASNIGIGVPRLAHAKYVFSTDGGVIGLITLALTAVIPANAIIYKVLVNSTVAFVGAGASVAVGISAGSAANSLLTATAITSLGLDAVVVGVATPFKTTAAGNITITGSAATITAGELEIFVEYVVAVAA